MRSRWVSTLRPDRRPTTPMPRSSPPTSTLPPATHDFADSQGGHHPLPLGSRASLRRVAIRTGMYFSNGHLPECEMVARLSRERLVRVSVARVLKAFGGPQCPQPLGGLVSDLPVGRPFGAVNVKRGDEVTR